MFVKCQSHFQGLKNIILFFGFILFSCFLLGCNTNDNPIETIKADIGVLLPLSGLASSVSESAQIAVELAQRNVNRHFKNSNIGFEIELVIEDTGTDPELALQSLQNLYNQGITTVVGPYASANAAAILDYANNNGIVVLSPASVATSLSTNDNLYRLVPDDNSQTEAIAALFQHDQIKLLIPIVRNDIWGNGLMGNVKNNLDPDIHLSEIIHYDPATLNANRVAQQIQARLGQTDSLYSKEQVGVFLLTYDEGTEILAASQKLSDFQDTKWYGTSPYANNAGLLQNKDAVGFAKDHAFTCSVFGPDPDARNLWEPILDEMTSSLGRVPEVYALTMYDAVWLMALTWHKSLDSGTGFDFKNSLEETAASHTGITGKLNFNLFGDRLNWTFDFWGLSQDNSQYSWNTVGYYKDGKLEIQR